MVIRPISLASMMKCFSLVALVGALAPCQALGQGSFFINELYFDPPGNSGDATHEYVELRGVADASLANHFLIFIENEDNLAHTGGAGLIEAMFDLGAYSFGSNGFLTLRQKGPATSFGEYTVDAAATNLRNTGSGIGFGSNASTSSVGASVANLDGRLENSGFTAMLIRNDANPDANPNENKPTIGLDLDLGNNGLDVSTGRNGWTILDSIGVFAEFDEAWDPFANGGQGALLGRVYAPVNFGPENSDNTPGFTVPFTEPGATYVGLGYEIEYLARWGNSTGNAPADWHASNLTDNPASGYSGMGDLRQSGEPHPNVGSPPPPDQLVETNKNVPYGTNLTNTLGAPNYPLNVAPPIPGDFDEDGDVDGADLANEWKVRFGDDLDGEDFLVWQRNLGTGVPAVGAAQPAAGAVPEPAAAILAVASLIALQSTARRRSRSAAPVDRQAPRCG